MKKLSTITPINYIFEKVIKQQIKKKKKKSKFLASAAVQINQNGR